MRTGYYDAETQMTEGDSKQPFKPFIEYDVTDQMTDYSAKNNIYHNTFLELLDGAEEYALRFNNSEAVSLLKLHDVPLSAKYSIDVCGRLSNGRCILQWQESEKRKYCDC